MHSVTVSRPPFDKMPEFRVTVAIGAALVVQTSLALIWAGAASERLTQLERRADTGAAMIERTARLEEQVRFMSATLQRIEEKIDRQAKEQKQ